MSSFRLLGSRVTQWGSWRNHRAAASLVYLNETAILPHQIYSTWCSAHGVKTGNGKLHQAACPLADGSQCRQIHRQSGSCPMASPQECLPVRFSLTAICMHWHYTAACYKSVTQLGAFENSCMHGANFSLTNTELLRCHCMGIDAIIFNNDQLVPRSIWSTLAYISCHCMGDN